MRAASLRFRRVPLADSACSVRGGQRAQISSSEQRRDCATPSRARGPPRARPFVGLCSGRSQGLLAFVSAFFRRVYQLVSFALREALLPSQALSLFPLSQPSLADRARAALPAAEGRGVVERASSQARPEPPRAPS